MFRDRRAVVLDLEGVIFAGREVLPGAREVMAALAGRGIPHRFITNISRLTEGEIRAHMAAIGVDPGPGRIVGVVERAGACLRRCGAGGPVLLLGAPALRAAIEGEGFEVIPPEEEARAGAVVVGIDEGVNYRSLSAAARAVAGGAGFFAMNPDVRMPLEEGGFALGGGAIAAAVAAAAGRSPRIIGKPEPFLFEEALAELGAAPAEAVMVGDNLRTDIAGGRRVGMGTVWINRWGALEGDPEVAPDLEVRRVDEILPHLPGA